MKRMALQMPDYWIRNAIKPQWLALKAIVSIDCQIIRDSLNFRAHDKNIFSMGLNELIFPSTLFGSSRDDLAPATDRADAKERISSDTGSITTTDTGSISTTPDPVSPTGSSRSSITTVQSRSLRASLPSSWYTSETFFALETRAIFSQVNPISGLQTDRVGMALSYA